MNKISENIIEREPPYNHFNELPTIQADPHFISKLNAENEASPPLNNSLNYPINPVSRTSNSTLTHPIKKPSTTADWLVSSQFKKSLAEVVPTHLKPERICRIALTELRRNPRLQECSMQSFLGAIMNASEVGLEIGEVLGHAYLIPRKGVCQFHLGYKGMLELGKRADVLITSNLVYPGEDFYASYGNDENIKHIVSSRFDKNITNSQYLCVYAYIRTKDNKFKMEIMYPEDIQAVMQRSPTAHKPDSPWVKDFKAMAKKTVIRQIFKYMPMSNEIARAVTLDEQAEIGIQYNDFPITNENENDIQ